MRAKEFPLKELNKRAWQAVARELGPAGFVRFLQQYEGGTGDYTRDRNEILATVTEANLEADLKKVRQEIMRDPALRGKVAMPGKRREPGSQTARKAADNVVKR